MNIRFFELPPALRVGGLEKAARELEQGLRAAGARVTLEGDAQAGEVAHFHGLWSPRHLRQTARCRRLGVPYIVSPHGMLEPWAWRTKRYKKWPYFLLFEGPRLRHASAVLATAPQEAERIRDLARHARVEVLRLGSHLHEGPDYEAARATLGWAPGERVLLFLSRLHPKKGLRELIAALGNLPESTVRGHRLVVVGEDDEQYAADCRQRAEALRVKMRVDWHPGVWGPEKWRYLQGADLMCLPTYSENFGLVVLEACQVGTPVLTTVETPWVPLRDAGYGWVTETTVPAYEAALRAFFSGPVADSSFRDRLAAWTRAHYSWKQVIPDYLDLYRRALTPQKRIGP